MSRKSKRSVRPDGSHIFIFIFFLSILLTCFDKAALHSNSKSKTKRKISWYLLALCSCVVIRRCTSTFICIHLLEQRVALERAPELQQTNSKYQFRSFALSNRGTE